MLALTRKVGEKIVVGDNITITIVDIKGDNVRLSFDAPREIKIYRGEIFEAIARENLQAAAPLPAGELDMLKGIQKK